MGIESAALLGTLLVASTATQIIGGVAANKSAKAEASLQADQAALARSEADAEAARVAKEGERFKTRQKLLFLKSGVTLEGSPLLIMEETRQETAKEVNAIQKRGVALQKLGLRGADITRNKGRSAFIGGITGGLSTLSTGYITGKGAGIF